MRSEPHKVSTLHQLFRGAWWFIRGVKGNYYRRICARCGFTGQAHWGLKECKCIRFKPLPGEKATWVKSNA